MKKTSFRFIAACLALASLTANAASDLQNYVQQCQRELVFNASDVPAMNCNDGFRFAFGGRSNINDFVIHKRINDSVDMLVACRWLNSAMPAIDAASIELIIHNRQNGSTCFFSAKDAFHDPDPNNHIQVVSTSIVSPTNFNPVHSATNPNADDFWLQPNEVDSKQLPSYYTGTTVMQSARCVGCHVQGPYIASTLALDDGSGFLGIAPYLAQFGLLNDGHDTVADMTAANHYHAVGSSKYDNPKDATNTSAFKAWDSIIYGNIPENPNTHKPTSDCSGACHSVGRLSTIQDLSIVPGNNTTDTLLPSLSGDIFYFEHSGVMGPYPDNSPYHWINRDTSSDGIDIETFTASQNRFAVLPYYCGTPEILEAQAVDSGVVFSTDRMSLIPDKLKAFNLRDGLVCLNADQPTGKCYDYAVSYKCSTKTDTWTPYYNNDKNAVDNGDHEERTAAVNAQIAAYCGSTAPPVGIQVQVIESHGFPIAQDIKGPNDKLQEFIPTGLICKNSDQSSGSCSNYAVRYSACRPRTEAYIAKIKNQWVASNFTNRFLTTTNNVSGAETRGQAENAQYPSQDWIIESIAGGNTVRLYDVWSGKYLTESLNSNSSGLAIVVVNNADTSQMRQQWVIETVFATNDVRLRNVGTGRYLTVGNYTGTDPYYAPIVSQSLSNQNWTSQRWIIQ